MAWAEQYTDNAPNKASGSRQGNAAGHPLIDG
jgi:hypothetical protein